MKRLCYQCVFLMLALAISAFADVTVGSPWVGSTVGSPVHYTATGTANNCNRGVASMGIYVNNVLKYTSNGSNLDTELSLDPGTYDTTVEEWDQCGGASYTHVSITVTNQTGVWVMTPALNGQLQSPVGYKATSNTSKCDKGVASMGVYVNNVLKYTTQGNSLDTSLSLDDGTYNTVVEEWDKCGGASYTPVQITVGGGGGGGGGGNGKTFTSIQGSKGWVGYGEYPPNYQICTDCGPGVTWSMGQHVKTPSKSGNSTKFAIGGNKPYSDVLFTNHLIGSQSSQGVYDKDHTLLTTLHNFTYDAYFYTTQLPVVQVLEFDISMYFNGHGLIFGTQCRVQGGHMWDVWNNVKKHWESTGKPCNPVNSDWNHVIIQVQRESDNSLLYQSITLNGTKYTLNSKYAPGTANKSWWGLTVNYQLDGNINQADYTTYLDDFNLTYQ